MNSDSSKSSEVQGEGDYEAARRHRESLESFVKSGKVEQAAHDAAPKTKREADELKDAEHVGESHSKGEDPGTAPRVKP